MTDGISRWPPAEDQSIPGMPPSLKKTHASGPGVLVLTGSGSGVNNLMLVSGSYPDIIIRLEEARPTLLDR